MLMVPEARTAILRTALVVAVAIACIIGAIRTDRRWARVLLAIVAVPITFLALLCGFIVSLIMRYGPR
jgi:hypothetical protein